MVTLLDRAKDFYAALLAERTHAAPSVVLFRSYMSQHFQEAGMYAADEVDKAHREGRTPHFLVRDKDAPAPQVSAPSYAAGYDANGPKFKSSETQKANTTQPAKQPVKSNAAPFKTMDISKGRSAAEPNQRSTQPTLDPAAQPQNDPSTVEGEESVLVAGGDILTPADIERIKTLQNSVIAQEYSREALVGYMEVNGIAYTPTAKPKQLAATLALHLQKK